jgi:peptide-methionine (S)-S-oxide reductase
MTKPSRSSLWAPLISLLCACHLASCTGSSPAQPAPHEKPISPAVAQQTAASERNVEAKTQPENSVNNKSQGATETATFGAGCFWCIEAVLQRIDGVIKIESGYMGGLSTQPTYDNVCSGTTGHAEVVRVQFDPAKLPYEKLCDWFFLAHDPTTKNRQGNDQGTQYRSVVFYYSDAQQKAALAAMERAKSHWSAPIVTEFTAATTFWLAEGYHQNYFNNNPTNSYCRALIPPKLKKLGLDSPPK